MSLLPQKPIKGADVLPWAKRMHDYVTEITPRSSGTVKVKRTMGGTTFATKDAFYVQPYHFQLIPDPDYAPGGDERKVACRAGFWARNAGAGIVKQDEIKGGGDTSGAAGIDLDDLAVQTAPIAEGDTEHWSLVWWDTSIGGPANISTSVDMELRIYITPAFPQFPWLGGTVGGAFKYLGSVTNTGGNLEFDQHWKGGNIDDFHLAPDGNNPQGTQTPEIRSLGYNSAGADANTEDLLEDWEAYQRLISDGDVTSVTGDQAFPFFDFVSGGSTDKDYARIDSSNYASHTGHRSLEILSDAGQYAQVFDFNAAGSGSFVDFWDDMGTGPGEFLIMARAVDADGAFVDYIKPEKVKVGDLDPGEDWCDWIEALGCDWSWLNEELFHTDLDPTGPSGYHESGYETNRDHNWRYATLGSEADSGIGGAYFTSIGYNTNLYSVAQGLVDLRIDLANMVLLDGIDTYVDWIQMLLQNAGTTDLDWGNHDLKGTPGEWTINDDQTYSAAFGNEGSYAGQLTDGTTVVEICNGVLAMDIAGDIEMTGYLDVGDYIDATNYINSDDVFRSNSHLGVDTGDRVRITKVGGGAPLEANVRGGLLCVD